MVQKRHVFGLVGPIGSGKGTLAGFLERKDFTRTSLSDRIREEIEKRGKSETRQILQDVGDDLRMKYGDGILAKMTAKKYKNEQKLVIDSIRNPGEIEVLKKAFGAVIIGVTAPRRKRFELIRKRNRKGDVKTWREFLERDKREFSKKAHSHQIQMARCLEMADFVLKNDGTEKELLEKAEVLVKKITG